MSHDDFLQRFEDAREYLEDVETHTRLATHGIENMAPSEAAPVHAQIAVAKALAGLAAAIYGTRKGQ